MIGSAKTGIITGESEADDVYMIIWENKQAEFGYRQTVEILPATNDDLMELCRKAAEKIYPPDFEKATGEQRKRAAQIIYDTFKGWEAKQ
jgi:hypothetical protein